MSAPPQPNSVLDLPEIPENRVQIDSFLSPIHPFKLPLNSYIKTANHGNSPKNVSSPPTILSRKVLGNLPQSPSFGWGNSICSDNGEVLEDSGPLFKLRVVLSLVISDKAQHTHGFLPTVSQWLSRKNDFAEFVNGFCKINSFSELQDDKLLHSPSLLSGVWQFSKMFLFDQ